MGRETRRGLGQTLERYRGLVDNAVEGIFQTTPEGRYLMANPMLARIYGYDSPDDLIQTLTDIAHQLYVDRDRRAAFLRILQEQDAVWGFESPVYRRDGHIIWISESARAVRGTDGRLLGFEGTVVDITSRKQAETERARAVAALEEARAELEVRVNERTAELARTNQELTEAHRELAAAEAEKKRFYREVIRCVTRGKFHLVDVADIPDPGDLILERTLESPGDDRALRHDIRQAAAESGMAPEGVHDLELAVGEAATNAIKHATYGHGALYRRGDRLVVRVSDRGAGIRAENLPATLLLPGFSTAVSLGMGYTLMLELVDRIDLATERGGTIIQLEKRLRPEDGKEGDHTGLAPMFAAWDQL
jgi:PAS domain S-box-containing protein